MQQLSEQNRQKLDGIVQEMINNGESESNIQFVVNDFKSIYGGNEETKIEPLGAEPLDSDSKPLTHPDDDRGFFDALIFDPVSKGIDQGSATDEAYDVLIGGDFSPEALKAYREADKVVQESGMTIEGMEYEKAVNKRIEDGENPIMAYFKELPYNKMGAAQYMIQSMVAAGTAGTEAPMVVAGTTVAGAALGLRGGYAGAGFGAVRGLMSGSMLALEGASRMTELTKEWFEENNLDWNNDNDWKKLQNDEDALQEIQRKGIGAGLTIAAAEYFGGKLGGKLVGKGVSLIGSKVGKAAAKTVGSVASEAIVGGAGEAGALAVMGRDITTTESLKEIGMESVIGTIGAPITAAEATFEQLKIKNQYIVNGGKTTKEKINSIIDNAKDEDFVNIKAKTNDPEINERIQERRKKIIKENKEAVKGKVKPRIVEDVENRLDAEISKLERQIKEVKETDGDIVAEAFELRLKELKEKKKGLNDQLNFQIDELSESETLNLMNINDDVSLYQSILNDPNSSDLAKQSAREQLTILKAAQLEAINNPDSVDMSREDGPRKQKNKDLSDKTQKAYEAKGKNSWGEVAKHQAGLINSIATSMWSKVPADKRVGTYDDFKAALVTDKGGILGLVKTYNPETGVPLAAYIANPKTGLRARANRIIKKYTKQEVQQSLDNEQIKSAYVENDNINNIELDRRASHEKLGLSEILGDLDNDTEIALQKTINELETLGEVNQKRRQEESLKAFNSIFNNKYSKKVKDFIGKNTKTKDDFSKFLKNNLPVLKAIALSNIQFQKGSSLISKTWNEITPSDKDFLDYYEGADSPSSQALSDRKNKLVKAITDQLATDARESYFENRPEERILFNEEQQLSFQQGEVVSNAFESIEERAKKLGISVERFLKMRPEDIQKLLPEEPTKLPDSTLNLKEQLRDALVLLKGEEEIGFSQAVDEFNILTQPIEKTVAEKLNISEKEAKKIISESRGQGRKRSKETTNFIETTLPKYFSKGIFDRLKNSFTTSSTSRLQYPNVKAYEDALLLAEFLSPDLLTKQERSDLAKIPFRPGLTKDYKNLTREEAAQKMLDSYKKVYDRIFSDIDKYNNKVNAQEKFLFTVLKGFEKAAKENPNNIVEIAAIILGQSESMSHFVRASASPKVFADPANLTIDDVVFNDRGIPKLIEEEHSFKAVLAARTMFNMIVNGTVDTDFPKLMSVYFQTGLLVKDNSVLNETYKDTMAPGTVFGDPLVTLRTYQEVGIDLEKYTSLINQVAEKIKTNEKGFLRFVSTIDAAKDPVTAKLQNAIQMQQDSLENFELSDSERIEALTDILGAAYPDKIIMTNKEDVIKYLAANYPNRFPSEKVAREAMNRTKGFRDPDVIYISKEKATLETVMHEFTHEWASLVNKKDPELFNAIYEKIKGHPRYAEAVARMQEPGPGAYDQMDPDSFNYKNEVVAFILGEEGASLYQLFEGDTEAKSLIDKFFDYVREALGFDPTVKNFSDLTVDEVIKLTVKDIAEGNPAANFDKLKNKAEGKSWFAKTEANQSPSERAKLDPVLRAFNKIKLAYRKDKNLSKAIVEAYKEVEGLMDFKDFVKLVVDNTKETKFGASKQLLIAKADAIKANKIAKESTKKLEESKIKEEDKSNLQNKFRRMIYTAAAEGAKASRWFIPPNAEDFKGLLYTFLPKGKAGIEARKFLEEHLLKPYSDGIAALDTEILNKSKAWEKMSKGYKLNEKIEGTPYTIGDAIKIYNAIQRGDDVTIAKQKHMDALIHAVESDQSLLDLAEAIEENFPINIKDGWQNKTLAKEIFDAINNGARERALETFNENVDAIFNDTTLDLIGDQFGNNFKQALKNTLRRMKSGRNRVSTDAQSNVWLNWINRAVGTTMFFNSRSALLQTISSLNFIGLKDNNIFQAAAAYANRKQFQEDYKKLWNSDYLKNRRDGAKFDVLADEIAEGDPQGINKLLKNGFLPTRYADSFAIALGGAAFYRNRVNALVKQGMDVKQAEQQAMNDWRKEAENSQQSADPSKISEIQASSLGRIIYAFANTPFQYARIVKRRLQDITSGRSAAEGRVQSDLGTILYYGAVQAVMFNALQSGLAALAFGDDDDEEIKKLKDKKYLMSIERGLTSFAKSLGNPGAVSATLYSLMKEGYLQQTGQKRPDPNAFAITATSISPPINSKLRDLASAYRSFNKIDEDDLLTPSLDNEALTMSGEIASFAGVPLDRVIRKARHLAAIKNEELEAWQKLWLVLGWNEWDLGIDTRADKNLFKEAKFDDDAFEEAEFEESTFKKLKPGVAGVANNDGTIELDPNLSPEEKRKTIQHEKQHLLDMKNKKIKLNYDDNFVYYKNKKYKRANGNIVYNGKSYIEGHPDLPWEKRAYKAEKTRKFLYA